MITAIVFYDLPPSIGLEECRAHFSEIAPDFLKIPGFLRQTVYLRSEREGRRRRLHVGKPGSGGAVLLG